MTSENELPSGWVTLVVPPNVWTRAMTVGEASDGPELTDRREVIEIFHANGRDLEFTVRSGMTASLTTDPADIENYDGWRARKTPYVDWANRVRAEQARAETEQLDPLAGHPLTALGATRPDVTQRNIDQGYLTIEDTDEGKHVRLTEAGKARAKQLLGLSDDFPLDEVT